MTVYDRQQYSEVQRNIVKYFTVKHSTITNSQVQYITEYSVVQYGKGPSSARKYTALYYGMARQMQLQYSALKKHFRG